MIIARLSRYGRIVTIHFCGLWTTPAHEPPPIPPDVAAAMADEIEARRRGNTQGVGEARQRARQARHDGLRRELAARQKEAWV